MAAYHFESVSESGFGVSGLLDADDERHARLKAKRFCCTCNLLRVEELEPGTDDHRAQKAGAVGRDAFRCETFKGRLVSLALSMWDALLRERPFRR